MMFEIDGNSRSTKEEVDILRFRVFGTANSIVFLLRRCGAFSVLFSFLLHVLAPTNYSIFKIFLFLMQNLGTNFIKHHFRKSYVV